MRNLSLRKLFLLALVATTFLTSCKDDAYLLTTPPVANQSFSEGCDSASAMVARGWKFVNASYPKGGGVWQNGGDVTAPLFNAWSHTGSYAGFIGNAVNCVRTPVAADAAPYTLLAPTAAQGFVNNWLISPETLMQNGDKIVFYTRAQKLGSTTATDSTDWGNRLQVRINKNGTDLNVGDVKPLWQWLYTSAPDAQVDNAGSYDIVLLDINRNNYEWHKDVDNQPLSITFTSVIDGRIFNANTNLQAYPVKWTKFEVTVSGLSEPTKGRFAFRYYVPGGDPNNGYASAIGIDNIEYKTVGY